MRVFIFAIGGTGVRVLRSFTHLLASTNKSSSDHEIVPVIIDLDVKNGDTNRTVKLLNSYNKVNQAGKLNNQSTFFSKSIRNLRSLENGNNDKSPSFHLDFNMINTTFKEFIGYNSLLEESKEIVDLLYYDGGVNDPFTELNLNLTVGFKGNPNIGTVIFESIKNVEEFKIFENNFLADDRIIIIGSIFGGTGAAGIPSLINIMNHSDNTHIRDAKKAAFIYLPYFNVSLNDDSVILSEIFNSKAKAALSFYEREIDNKINRIYYLGDKPLNSLSASDGGENQTNPAHFIELIGAHGMMHFIESDNSKFLPNRTDYYEYGLKDINAKLTLKQFYDETKRGVFEPILKFGFATKFFLDHIKLNEQGKKSTVAKSLAFYNDLKLDYNIQHRVEYIELMNFFNDFKAWIAELKLNERKLEFLDLEAKRWENIVHDHKFQGKRIEMKYINSLEPVYVELRNELEENEFRIFLKMLTVSSVNTFFDKVESL